MNWLDIVLGLILIGSIAAGLSRGFTRTVIGLTAFVFGLLLSCWLYGSVGAIFLDYVSHRTVANFLGFVTVYALIGIAGALVGWALVRFYKTVGLNWLDRLLGGGIGLARGFVIGSVFVMALMGFSRNPPPESVVHSRIAPYMVDGARILSWIAPRELRDGVSQSYAKVLEIWKKSVAERLKSLPKEAF
ncbi:MAG: CvpA family protein [Acidobacteriota bacterium]